MLEAKSNSRRLTYPELVTNSPISLAYKTNREKLSARETVEQLATVHNSRVRNIPAGRLTGSQPPCVHSHGDVYKLLARAAAGRRVSRRVRRFSIVISLGCRGGSADCFLHAFRTIGLDESRRGIAARARWLLAAEGCP